jgi:hypothetical protein
MTAACHTACEWSSSATGSGTGGVAECHHLLGRRQAPRYTAYGGRRRRRRRSADAPSDLVLSPRCGLVHKSRVAGALVERFERQLAAGFAKLPAHRRTGVSAQSQAIAGERLRHPAPPGCARPPRARLSAMMFRLFRPPTRSKGSRPRQPLRDPGASRAGAPPDGRRDARGRGRPARRPER